MPVPYVIFSYFLTVAMSSLSNPSSIRDIYEAYLVSLGVSGPFLLKDLMVRAFTHKSYAADSSDYGPLTHNERLEFLGDAVLGSSISLLLYKEFPTQSEAQLTLSKIFLVKETTLAQVAQNINLGKYLLLGNGEEKSGGRYKSSVLSDALEAVIAYVYLEKGQEAVESFVKKHIYTMLDRLDELPTKSYKSLVQELIQKHRKEIPVYEDVIVNQESSGNVLTYGSTLSVQGKVYGQGYGPSKKKAQEIAAQNAYETLRTHL